MNVRVAANRTLTKFTICNLGQALAIPKLCKIAPMGMSEGLIDDKSPFTRRWFRVVRLSDSKNQKRINKAGRH